jgi:4-hydroxy-tetrahydrodipicolinate synthase
MRSQFQGIWIPIVTPFRSGHVDHPALAQLARHLAEHGVAGLIAGATTGEGVLLQPGELEALFATLREAVPELPIVLGLTQYATHAAIDGARALATLKPDGLLVTAPTYVRPTQQGIQHYFEAIAEAADLPILIYNIPYRSGVDIELETLQQLAVDPRIVAVKECGGSLERLTRLVHETPLSILSGEDCQNFAALCVGAQGTIAASAHILPHWHVQIYNLLQQDELASARSIAVALQPLVRSLFMEPNPAPLKAWLADQDHCTDEVRAPFIRASTALRERLHTVWIELQTRVLPDPGFRFAPSGLPQTGSNDT